MATHKHAMIRYLALDKCFRNVGRKYFVDDLINGCNDAVYKFSGINDGIKKRQLYYDIIFMESEEGWSIPLVKHKMGRKIYYRYKDTSFSITNQPLNESEANKLKEAMLTLNRFKGMPQFEWVEELIIRLESSFDLLPTTEKIIEFEHNPYLKGVEFVSDLYHAILYKKVLLVTYKSFKQPSSTSFEFHPHYLKQFNNRWFLFGFQNGYDSVTNLALDRIEKIEDSTFEYKKSKIDYEEYFEDVIGVSIPENETPSKVLIKVTNNAFQYITSKPLHGSQKIKSKDELSKIIELEVYLNYELISLILSFGDSIEVLAPIKLREIIKSKSEALFKNHL